MSLFEYCECMKYLLIIFALKSGVSSRISVNWGDSSFIYLFVEFFSWLFFLLFFLLHLFRNQISHYKLYLI